MGRAVNVIVIPESNHAVVEHGVTPFAKVRIDDICDTIRKLLSRDDVTVQLTQVVDLAALTETINIVVSGPGVNPTQGE